MEVDDMVANAFEAQGFADSLNPAEDWFADDVPALSDDAMRGVYREMVEMRKLEEAAGKAYGKGKISGFLHLYIGQEAVASGSTAAMRPSDYMISGYRDHAQALAKGISGKAIMAELFGKATGCSKGKGGSMHMYDAGKRFLGGDGIVGGQIPLAAGVGWAIQYRKSDDAIVCFFGDAASNQGVFHEALNMSMLWNLPVVYVVENNLYGMGTAISRTSATNTLSQRALAYDMPMERVDGQHFIRMYETMHRALERARKGVPTLVEAVCYRFRGHSVSDPATYRTRDEVDQARMKDPIKVVKAIMEARGIADADWFKETDKEVKAVVAEAVAFADESPVPPEEWIWEDVLVGDEV